MPTPRLWFTLNKKLIQKYSLATTHPHLRGLPLQICYTAVSPLGGPIAVLLKKNQSTEYTLSNELKESIFIYDARGHLRTSIKFQLKQRIVLFAFLPNESLLLLYATGQYFLMDPFSGQTTAQGTYLQEKDRALGAELQQQHIVILLQKDCTLGVILRKAFQPMVRINAECPVFSSTPNNQLVYITKQITVQLYNYTTQVKKTILPAFPQIYKSIISLSLTTLNAIPTLAMVSDDNTLHYICTTHSKHTTSTKFTKENLFNRTTTRTKYRNNYFFAWLNDIAVFSDGNTVVFFDGTSFVQQAERGLLQQECDGIRSVFDFNSMYRVITPMYAQLIDPTRPCNHALLVMMKFYSYYLERQVIHLQGLKLMEEDAAALLRDVLDSAAYCTDIVEEIKILKFTLFVSNVFAQKGSKHLHSLCSELRIVNGWRHQARWITVHQLRYIREHCLVTLLLRYNLHFFADVVFVDGKSKEAIFLHWSKCKIEKHQEAVAMEAVLGKYTELKLSSRVFTQLAKYALDHQKPNLALKLIEQQRHPNRRIMVALLIHSKLNEESLEKVLQFGQACTSSSSLYRIFKELRKHPHHSWVSLLHKRPQLQRHYIKYLQQQDEAEQINNYYIEAKMSRELGIMRLRGQSGLAVEQFKEVVIQNYKALMPTLVDSIKKSVDCKHMQMLRQLQRMESIREEDCAEIRDDRDLEYAAEIIIRKDKNYVLAYKLISKIKSDKVYGLFLIRGEVRKAMDVAHQRKDKKVLQELIEKSRGGGDEDYGVLLMDDLVKNK